MEIRLVDVKVENVEYDLYDTYEENYNTFSMEAPVFVFEVEGKKYEVNSFYTYWDEVINYNIQVIQFAEYLNSREFCRPEEFKYIGTGISSRFDDFDHLYDFEREGVQGFLERLVGAYSAEGRAYEFEQEFKNTCSLILAQLEDKSCRFYFGKEESQEKRMANLRYYRDFRNFLKEEQDLFLVNYPNQEDYFKRVDFNNFSEKPFNYGVYSDKDKCCLAYDMKDWVEKFCFYNQGEASEKLLDKAVAIFDVSEKLYPYIVSKYQEYMNQKQSEGHQ